MASYILSPQSSSSFVIPYDSEFYCTSRISVPNARLQLIIPPCSSFFPRKISLKIEGVLNVLDT